MKVLSHMCSKMLGTPRRFVAFAAAALAASVVVALPGMALATETPTEEGVKTIATNVSTEGVKIILIVLTALVALIVAVIVIPKAIGFIRRFV